ncbi:MAG TPA: aminotransferase class III-fold pyridoxal phosphate-dependent enzyme, partial [Noviherbaspirillum sp.]
NLLENVRERGQQLMSGLRERFAGHPYVGEVRGRGLFQGVELVADRETKQPFDAKLKVHAKIKAEALARGLMVYPMGGTIDGSRGDHVLLAPPFIASAETIAEIIDRLADAIDVATGYRDVRSATGAATSSPATQVHA